MPELILNLDIICSECGSELEFEEENYIKYKIKPCQNCISLKYNNGYSHGFIIGYDEGVKYDRKHKKYIFTKKWNMLKKKN